MKKFSVFLCTLVLLLSACIPISALAASDRTDDEFLNKNKDRDYVITAYNMDITVSEYNVLTVTETIDAYFNFARHGIYRTIPLRNEVQRTDGTTATIAAKIRQVWVENDDFSRTVEGNNYTLQIGDEDKTITGPHTYVIHYQYDLGRDTVAGADELYFNLIGTEWSNPIHNVSFRITMPKEFDANQLGFSSGLYGTVGTENIYCQTDGNTISGYYGTALQSGEALTMRLTLPDGYFKFNYAAYYLKVALIALIPTAILITVFVLFMKYGRDQRVTPTVEFYPPEGMNSAEACLWYAGRASQESVVSLLIYLANQGYLKIEEGKRKRSFTLYKRKDYAGSDLNEALFFDVLFPKGVTTTDSKDLEEKFYVYIQDILSDLNSKKSRSRIFSSKSIRLKILSFLLIALGLAVSLFCTYLTVSAALIFDTPVCIALGVAALATLAAIIINCFMLQRTEQGAAMLAKLTGFRNFLETAEKEKLEALVEEDPEYFYNILPYTYALGVSDKWIKKFESIAMEPPVWYYGHHTMFDYMMFSNFMNRTMQAANHAMTSQPQSSGSGFSGGGGGFSGGGAGGGGGGSW